MYKMTNLKRIRKERKIKQTELAERAGVSLRTLQDYEQGQKPINGASALTVYKIAEALECSVGEILELTEEV